MKPYKLTYLLDDNQEKRLSAIAGRYREINGWGENDILQFAVTAFTQSDMERKLDFLENKIGQLEKEKTE